MRRRLGFRSCNSLGLIHAIRDQPKVDRIIDRDGVVVRRADPRDASKPYCVGFLAMMVDGQDDGDVVLGFLRQDVAIVELPEISVSGALDGGLNGAGAGVVRSHGEIPVAELVVEIFQMACGGASRILRILTIVHTHVVVQAVSATAAAHELPDAAAPTRETASGWNPDSACAR